MRLHPGVKYLVIGIAIATDILEDRLIDAHLIRRGLNPQSTIIDDVITGGLVGLVLFFLIHALDRTKQEERQRAEIIREMNHHVRNALQVIQCSSWASADRQHLERIGQAVNRIEWALREVLPGKSMPSALEPEALANVASERVE
jgi:hypothetical protein